MRNYVYYFLYSNDYFSNYNNKHQIIQKGYKMNFLIFSFLFSIPIAIWIFKNYKTTPNPITKHFFIHCLFLIFSAIFVINYHINYLGIISYISSSCFVLFCVCNDIFTSEEKNKFIRIIKEWSFNNE